MFDGLNTKHKHCKSCGIHFIATRATAQFCSAKCRMRHLRLNHDCLSVTSELPPTEDRLSVTSRCSPPPHPEEGLSRGVSYPVLYEGMIQLDSECPYIGSGYRSVIVTKRPDGRVSVTSKATGFKARISSKTWDAIAASKANRSRVAEFGVAP